MKFYTGEPCVTLHIGEACVTLHTREAWSALHSGEACVALYTEDACVTLHTGFKYICLFPLYSAKSIFVITGKKEKKKKECDNKRKLTHRGSPSFTVS